MADEQQQTEHEQDPTDDREQDEGESAGSTTAARGDGQGDEGGDNANLLKALKAERERAAKAERELKRIDGERRKADTERAIKAGEWEAVAKAKDGEIADLNTRIAELEGQLTERDISLTRERVGAAHKLPADLVELLRGKDEAEMAAHAKRLAKLIPPPTAPNTEAGRGNGQGGGKTDLVGSFIQQRNEDATKTQSPLGQRI